MEVGHHSTGPAAPRPCDSLRLDIESVYVAAGAHRLRQMRGVVPVACSGVNRHRAQRASGEMMVRAEDGVHG